MEFWLTFGLTIVLVVSALLVLWAWIIPADEFPEDSVFGWAQFWIQLASSGIFVLCVGAVVAGVIWLIADSVVYTVMAVWGL